MAKTQAQKNKRLALTVLLVLLLFILTAVLAVFIVINHYLNKINRIDPSDVSVIPPEAFTDTDDTDYIDPNASLIVDDPEPDTSAPDTDPSIDPPDTKAPETTSKYTELHDENLLNIMIVGQDSSSYTKRTRTDSMILISINTETGKMSAISFLRDIYVSIPGGYVSNRLNVPYRLGGFPLLYKTLEKNFGVHVDYGFAVNYDGFKKIIDVLGGVDITITDKEYEYMKSYMNVVPGLNHFNGEEALSFARIRKLDNDFQRTGRQRRILNSLYEKIKKASLSDILTAVDGVLPYLLTDMTNSEILSTVKNLYSFIKNGFSAYSIPASGTFKNATIAGKAVLKVDFEANRRKLLEYLPLN